MKTTATIIETEEINNVTTLILSDGLNVSFETIELIKFIEENEMNVVSCSNGSVGDPTAEEYDLIEDVEDYLDRNYDEVCRLYFKFNLNK